MSEHHRRLERMYASARSQNHYTTEITIGDGWAEQSLPVREDFFHAASAVHGSVYFKVADDTCFFAAQSVVEDLFVLTTSLNLHLLRPVTEGSIHGRATVVNTTRSTVLCEATLTNDAGKRIAHATAAFTTSSIPLGPDLGYR